MTGGLVQLVAYGKENVYLNGKPQITFFKQIYRRHTNFATEDVPQNFQEQPNFGKKYTCKISTEGDLANKMCMKITLPYINLPNGECRWNKYIGFSMINYVEVEIGNKIIDKHYGEWMYIWSCLTTRNIKDNGFNKLIGNVKELTEFSSSKEQYIVYVPLYFWFCRDSGLSVPLVSMQLDNININISFNPLSECLLVIPTYYIQCSNYLVNFEKYEIIAQASSLTGTTNYGIYYDYDIITQKLYYTPISQNKLDASAPIYNITNGYYVSPQVSATSFIIYNNTTYKNINMIDCVILVNYIYIDIDERKKFLSAKMDYLIEQLYYTPQIAIQGTHPKIQLTIDQPCKLTVWLVQLDNMIYANELYNYTSFYDNNTQESLLTQTLIKLNSQDRISQRTSIYYEYIQPIQHTNNVLPRGCFMYSYSLFPCESNPSGTTNMTEIDLIELGIKANNIISKSNTASFRSYSLCYNVWRVSSGVSATIFIN
jgi:hypothetical protein